MLFKSAFGALFCFLGFISHAVLAAPLPPQISSISTVAPDVLALTVRTGKVIHGRQQPYAPQPGDRVITNDNGPHRWLKRRGEYIGALVGRNNNIMFGFDRFAGEPLDTRLAERTQTYAITSETDPNYSKKVIPLRVSRKSRPIDMAQVDLWDFEWPVEHRIYLQLSKPLLPGASYRIRFTQELFADQIYVHQPDKVLSEAVHVSQLGFRTDDAVKVAYLSLWKGNGGAQKYTEGSRFRVLNNEDDKEVFSGTVKLSLAAEKFEDIYERNYNKTHVYSMNFSEFQQPGSYRICVDDIGCSYPFPISEEVWEKAFITSARGLYNQRSGIALKAEYGSYVRPRTMHPDDGLKVFESEVPLMDTGNGLNARKADKGNFHLLNKHRTSRLVENAWGGYADAGDWDRRIQHLIASRYLLELLEMFPHYFAELKLGIPESVNDLPDILDEALWGLDIYRRLQTPDGGIRGGIESEEHTRFGEGSWQESLTVMAYEPGMWSSYIYAGVAARAALWLQEYQPDLALVYRRSALDAMQWAESSYKNHDYVKLSHKVVDARNLAAIELYRLTEDDVWHQLFLRTTVFKEGWRKLAEWQNHDQADAAFIYVQLSEGDPMVKKNAMAAFEKTAADAVEQGKKTAFRWTKDNPGAWVGWGVLSVPQTVNLVRAHYLTLDKEFVDTTLYAAQFGAGANPSNMIFTTGLGVNSPKNPLIRDQRVSNQAPPDGITLNGPHDVDRLRDQWTLKLLDDVMFPPYFQWPTTESYLDIYSFEPVTEFTIQSTIAPNAYVWGYLAARPPTRDEFN